MGLLAFIALSASAGADPRASARPELFQEGSGRVDLDGDGVEDCWRLNYDGGSGYGWFTLQLQAPCSAPVTTIRIGGSFGDFISVGSLPRTIAQRDRLLRGVLDHWFGSDTKRKLSTIDGSLSWLINVVSTPAPKAHSGWNQGQPYSPHWIAGELTLPPTQVVALLTEQEQRLARQLYRSLAVDDVDSPLPTGPALLVYNAHSHHSIREAARARDLEVYVTDHAVAVRDVSRQVWSWAYVATDQEKLRNASIARATTANSLVVVEESQSAGVSKLIVIDPQSGRWMWREDGLSRGWSFDKGGLRLGDVHFSIFDLRKFISGTPS
jgi:hypothetical protein